MVVRAALLVHKWTVPVEAAIEAERRQLDKRLPREGPVAAANCTCKATDSEVQLLGAWQDHCIPSDQALDVGTSPCAQAAVCAAVCAAPRPWNSA